LKPNDIPIVLLHGFLGSKHDWHDVATSLRSGRRIAVFDLPGHGDPVEAREDSDCSMEAACHRIDAVLEAVESEKAHIVGYSFGGRVALHFAITRPDKVASLVLEGTSAGIQDEDERSARRDADTALAHRLEQEGLEAFVDAWEKLPLFASQLALDPEIRDAQRKRRLEGDAGALARSLRHAGVGTQPWLGAHLSKVQAPVLLLTGALDTKFTAIANELAAALPDARTLVIEGAGHNVHLEKPAEFIAAVDRFLSGVARAAAPRPTREGDRES